MTTTLTIVNFDYRGIEPVRAKELKAVAARVRECQQTATEALLQAGAALIPVKRELSGRFQTWVEVECRQSLDTVERWMRAANFCATENRKLRILPPSALYRVSQKSTPKAVVSTVLRRVEAGQPVTDKQVKALIDRAKSKLKPKPAPVRQEADEYDGSTFEAEDDKPEAVAKRKHDNFLVFANDMIQLAKYDGPIDSNVVSMAQRAAEAWVNLANEMQAKLAPPLVPSDNPVASSEGRKLRLVPRE